MGCASPASPLRARATAPRLALLVLAAALVVVLISLPVAAAAAAGTSPAARKLLQWGPNWGGPAYADVGRGTFAYSGLVGMPGSPSVIRRPGFFVSGGWGQGWGRK